MGTNYYLRTNACPHCGRSDEERHIGKSSAGWCFSLHVYPDEGIRTLKDWEAQMKTLNSGIYNEYGDKLDYKDMITVICDRKWDRKPKPVGYDSWEDFNNQNHSVNGPNGLSRHQIDNRCIGHGEGTWDYLIGDFS
jgi:hypothetical protein